MAGTPRGAGDPQRRERILEATLVVIAQQGVHRTTHRSIAEEAELPLGSLTYYFESLAQIRQEAFGLLVERVSARFREALAPTATPDEACEILADLITGKLFPDSAEMVQLFEMYALANQDAVVAKMAHDWLFVTRDVLTRIFSEQTARALDALVEGWPMHRHFEGRPLDRELVLTTLKAVAESTGHLAPVS